MGTLLWGNICPDARQVKRPHSTGVLPVRVSHAGKYGLYQACQLGQPETGIFVPNGGRQIKT